MTTAQAERTGPDGAGVPGLPPGLSPGLGGALLESRQRWRDLAALACDFLFETDADGRLVFVSPDRALGWSNDDLLGHPADRLLLRPEPDPFALKQAARGLKVWLRLGDGGTACLDVAVAPLSDEAGRFAGLRGSGRDVTEEMREAAERAAGLRRAETTELLLRRIRREVLAPRMVATMLELLPGAVGAVGSAVLEGAPGAPPAATVRHGGDPGPLIASLPPLDQVAAPLFQLGPEGERIALLPQPRRGAPLHALLVWRAAGGRAFDGDDRHLLNSMADLLFVALGNQARQRELELLARTEGLTGLANRRAFLDDLRRRLDRVTRPALPGEDAIGGTLLFLDLDNFKPINDELGHEAGDAALVAVARLLRDLVRPGDLAARLGGDEFALWLDGADADTALRRAEEIRAAGRVTLAAFSAPLSFSMGCAVARRGSTETAERLLARANAAMYAAKHAGRDRCVLAAEAS